MSIDIAFWFSRNWQRRLLNIKINYHKWTTLITELSFFLLGSTYILKYMVLCQYISYVYRNMTIVIMRNMPNGTGILGE